MSLFVKDPDSRIDYCVDWGAAFLGTQLIVTSNWTVSPEQEGGLSVAASAHDGRKATVTLTGWRPGASYALVNRITLSNGEVDERSVAVRVEQR